MISARGPRLLVSLTAALAALAAPAAAQPIDFRLGAIDMHGGVVFPRSSDPGVAFGARLGLADLCGRALQGGIELDWWTADRRAGRVELRDVVVGLAFWHELAGARAFRPYLGLSGALHSVDTASRQSVELDGDAAAAESLEGYRIGASGFAGGSVRLSRTGAIWLVLEYRFSAVSRVSHHMVRAGVRLLRRRDS